MSFVISHCSEYDDIDWRADDQYWASETNLVVQQVERHASQLSWPSTDGDANVRRTHGDAVSQIAVKQLERFVDLFCLCCFT